MLRRGRIAAPPLDMGSAPLDYSAYASQMCASCQVQDRSEPRYKGYSRGAARGHPKHIDERHHLNPAPSVEMEDATEQPTRARRRRRGAGISAWRRTHEWPGGTRCQQPREE